MAGIRVHLFWWGDDVGRLVLIRTIDRRDSGECDVWRSDRIHEDEAADAGLILEPPQWRELASGARITRGDLAVPLYRVSARDTPEDQRAMGHALTHPDFHRLVTITPAAINVGPHRLASPFYQLTDLLPPGRNGQPARAWYDVTVSNAPDVPIGIDR